MLFIFLSSLFVLSTCYTVKQPEISLLPSNGIRFAYKTDGSENLVAYHYNINQPLAGVEAATHNYDVNSPTDGYFVHENTQLSLSPGDTVSYWLNVITTSGGYTLTDQVWTVSVPTTQPPATEATTKLPTDPPTDPPTNEPPTVVTTQEPSVTTESSENGGSGGIVVDSCSKYPCDSSVCDMSQAPCNGLIFEENWDDLNLERWQHELTMGGGGNWEFQMYTNNRSNSFVRDNTLFIKPTLTADHYGEAFLSSGTVDLWGASPADFCTGNAYWGCQRTGTGTNYINPVKSARIRTVNSFSFKYGRVEVDAKMPVGDWLWPAIWFLPTHNRYGTWPASGEIDLLESRGNLDLRDSNGVSHGNDAIGSTMHWGPFWPYNGYELTTKEVHGTFGQEFHKYEVDWDENAITFFVDGVQILKVDPGDQGFWNFGDFGTKAPGTDNPWSGSTNKMTPFDQEMYMIINLAVGGTNGYFPDSWTNGHGAKPWSNNSPTAMRDFWEAKNNWYPTWNADVNNGEDAALQVRRIRVWAK